MKKRYYLTLTSETVEEFQELLKVMGLPPVTLSNICDEAIQKHIDIIKHIRSKGAFTATDLLHFIANEIDEIPVINNKKTLTN